MISLILNVQQHTKTMSGSFIGQLINHAIERNVGHYDKEEVQENCSYLLSFSHADPKQCTRICSRDCRTGGCTGTDGGRPDTGKIRRADTGHRGADAGYRSADTSHRGADAGDRGPDTIYRGADASHRNADTGHRSADTGHRVPDASYGRADTGCRLSGTECRFSDAGYRSANTSHGVPDTSCF